MLDVNAFSDEKFDPKTWINNACQFRHPQDSVDKHFSDLEMKLQLLYEEITSSLEEQSAAALIRVPRATRDILRLQENAVSLRSAVSGILIKLKNAEAFSSEAINSLSKIDTVKRRMEAAYETLQDAAGLTQLSASVEEVFASGNLSCAAETLANMRHCLAAVGEVAEFANVRKQLAILEDRLEEIIQPRLSDALSNRNVEVVQELRQVLIQIERFKSLELLYTKTHMKPICKMWEMFESPQQANKIPGERHASQIHSDVHDALSKTTVLFTDWLPCFYDKFLIYLEQEWKWCMIALPDDYKVVVPRLVVELMSSVRSSFVSRINVTTGYAVPETKSLSKGILDILSGDMPKRTTLQLRHLESLIELHNVADAFARNVQHLFSASDPPILASALKSVYAPFGPYRQRYCQMEELILSADISEIDLRGAVARGVGAQGVELSETVRRMEESVPQVIVHLEAAVERCFTFTGGSEADGLISILDNVMLQYISFLHETLKSVRVVCGVGDGSFPGVSSSRKELGHSRKEGARIMDMVSDEEEWSIVQGALQILTVADCLTSRCSVFEASLRGTLARLSTTLSLPSFNLDMNPSRITADDESEMGLSRLSLDMSTLFLSDAPEKANKLNYFLNQLKDPRVHVLPHASQRVMVFTEAVNELVYDVLISKVRLRLSEVSQLPVWSSMEETTSHPLPSFSVYPQAYVTSVGEYLLTLPQQLEPLAEGMATNDLNGDVQLFATEWMFKVAEGAAALFIEQLRSIQYITDRGAHQLSADIDYLSNVLSALSVPVPLVLATFSMCLSTPREQLQDLLKSDGGSHLDLSTAHLICRMRHVNLDK